jgi:hypothetical protein
MCVLSNSLVTSHVLPLRRFETHLHQLEERSKIEMHKSSLLQQQVRRVTPASKFKTYPNPPPPPPLAAGGRLDEAQRCAVVPSSRVPEQVLRGCSLPPLATQPSTVTALELDYTPASAPNPCTAHAHSFVCSSVTRRYAMRANSNALLDISRRMQPSSPPPKR